MRLHAAALSGEWINDPNALFFHEGHFHLFVQHAADAPHFRAIGWGSYQSDDLLSWRWQGRLIEPDAQGRCAYSGSVALAAGEPQTALTRHDPRGPMQSQEWRGDGGCESFGPSGRDCRDPFILSAKPGARAILVARPCNWSDWKGQPPSRLEIWREATAGWRHTGTIGPWSEPGVLWEVPQLMRVEERDVLLISQVDRRQDRAVSSVRYWIGDLLGDHFTPDNGSPAEGRLLDLGPDFYAAIAATTPGPHGSATAVAWASNWDYARALASRGQYAGAITLPRQLTLSTGGQLLLQHPSPQHREYAWRTAALPNGGLRLVAGADRIEVASDAAGVIVSVERQGLGPHRVRMQLDDVPHQATIFRDGPLIEIFLEPAGVALTTVFPTLTDQVNLELHI